MKANEWRVENWVTELGIESQINGHHIIYADNYKNWDVPKPKWKPISLTEEWLKKFGFIKLTKPQNKWYKQLKLGNIIFIHSGSKYLEYNSQSLFRCKYVHQLQNFYFVLTGKELIIK